MTDNEINNLLVQAQSIQESVGSSSNMTTAQILGTSTWGSSGLSAQVSTLENIEATSKTESKKKALENLEQYSLATSKPAFIRN